MVVSEPMFEICLIREARITTLPDRQPREHAKVDCFEGRQGLLPSVTSIAPSARYPDTSQTVEVLVDTTQAISPNPQALACLVLGNYMTLHPPATSQHYILPSQERPEALANIFSIRGYGVLGRGDHSGPYIYEDLYCLATEEACLIRIPGTNIFQRASRERSSRAFKHTYASFREIDRKDNASFLFPRAQKTYPTFRLLAGSMTVEPAREPLKRYLCFSGINYLVPRRE